MEALDQLSHFICRASSDERLKRTHLSLYVALCNVWISNRFPRCYNVSRAQLMRLSHIQSRSTYHKVMSELVAMGYIRYDPSYHPRKGSTITLLNQSILKFQKI